MNAELNARTQRIAKDAKGQPIEMISRTIIGALEVQRVGGCWRALAGLDATRAVRRSAGQGNRWTARFHVELVIWTQGDDVPSASASCFYALSAGWLYQLHASRRKGSRW